MSYACLGVAGGRALLTPGVTPNDPESVGRTGFLGRVLSRACVLGRTESRLDFCVLFPGWYFYTPIIIDLETGVG